MYIQFCNLVESKGKKGNIIDYYLTMCYCIPCQNVKKITDMMKERGRGNV